jgi:hypothetical protein
MFMIFINLKQLAFATAGVLCLSQVAVAGDSFNHDVDHAQAAVGYSVPAAIDHAETAISNGLARDVDGLVSEARTALKAAEDDLRDTGDKHTARAVHCLEAAIEHGEKNHIAPALRHLRNAVAHLRAADD